MNAQPAGWFPDPHDPSQLRYWDGRAWTDHRSPRYQAAAPTLGGRSALPPPGPTGRWYFIITLVSAGLLASVPYFHAASRLERPELRKTGAWLAAAALVGFALIALSPTDAEGEPTGWLSSVAAVLMLGVMLLATLQLIGIRREVYKNGAGSTIRPPSGNAGAMATVEEARRKREEARRRAVRDPMMARELGIGRPGSRQYDDGGLLDLNLATEDELIGMCRVPPETAQAVVAARARLGRFLQVDDAITFGQIGEEHVPLVRDRGIVIADK